MTCTHIRVPNVAIQTPRGPEWVLHPNGASTTRGPQGPKRCAGLRDESCAVDIARYGSGISQGLMPSHCLPSIQDRRKGDRQRGGEHGNSCQGNSGRGDRALQSPPSSRVRADVPPAACMQVMPVTVSYHWLFPTTSLRGWRTRVSSSDQVMNRRTSGTRNWRTISADASEGRQS